MYTLLTIHFFQTRSQITTRTATGDNKMFRLPIRPPQLHSSKGLEMYCRIYRNRKRALLSQIFTFFLFLFSPFSYVKSPQTLMFIVIRKYRNLLIINADKQDAGGYRRSKTSILLLPYDICSIIFPLSNSKIQKTPLMDSKSNMQVVMISKAVTISPAFHLVLGFIRSASMK